MLLAAILELGVRLRCLLRRSPEPRQAAEQSLEDIARPRWRVKTFGVVAGDKIAGPAACPRLQVGKIGLHTRNLAVELAALRRRIRSKYQELAVAAAKRARIGAGAPELGPLTLNGGLRAARSAASGDRLLQAGAFTRVLR